MQALESRQKYLALREQAEMTQVISGWATGGRLKKSLVWGGQGLLS